MSEPLSRLADAQHPIVADGIWKQYRLGVLHHRLGDALTGWWRRRHRDAGADEEGTFWALKDVSFTVRRGETLGIIGRNGAGKSTMLKLLSGISKPTRGALSVCGKLAALIEVGAGFHPDLTGRENVYLNGTILGLKRQEIRAVFDDIIEFAEIGPFIDTPVKRYSSGMYVRLGFAIAVHINPDILLVDEVLSVGDMAFQQKCMERIHELKQQGKTLIFISHNMSAVQRICDRALLLDQGQVVKAGEVDAVIHLYREQVVTKERERVARLIATRERSPKGARVRIEAVRLLDREGRPAERIGLGEPLTVEVAYACFRRVEAPTLRVGLERIDGFLCHVAWTRYDGAVMPPLEGRGVLRLRYAGVGLLPNTYRVAVEIGERGNPVPLDARKHAAFFAIAAEPREGGAVHLDYRWGWDGAAT